VPRHRPFVISLAVVGIGAAVAQSIAVPYAPDYLTCVSFLVALAIVGAFDVGLPRGDYAEMGGALVVAAAVLLHPILALAAAAGSRALVFATRRPWEDPWRVLEDTSRRTLLLALTSFAFIRMGGAAALRTLDAGGQVQILARVAAVVMLYLVLDAVLTQLGASLRLAAPLVPLLVGNLRLGGLVGTAQFSAAILAVVTYQTMGILGLVIVVGLLLVTRRSFSLLVDIRSAYRSTVEALARAIEAHDPQRRGHAERVAGLSTETARLLGQHGRQLEALTYAALFHDLGRLDADAEGGDKGSAEVLEAVTFLASAVPILRIIDAAGDLEASQPEEDLVAAYIVARMSEFDDGARGTPPTVERPVSGEIGARLYAATRRGVDKALRRIELRYQSGRLHLAEASAEEGW
jgi:hypothetical protein